MDINQYFDVSLDTLNNISKESSEYKTWSKNKKEKNSVLKYLNLIYTSFNDSKIIKKLKYNKDDDQYGPYLYYLLKDSSNNIVNIYINRPVKSYKNIYDEYNKNTYPAYSLNHMLVYIQKRFNISIWWSEIDSPCTKNYFVLRLGKDDCEDPIYIRNKNNDIEFPKTSDGYRDAAISLYLFYIKKYIYTINK